MACVFVDVDGTLIRGPSCEARFAAYLLRRGRLGASQLAQAALFVPRYAPRFGRHVLKKNKAYLAGLRVEPIAASADAFVRQELKPRLIPELLRRLEVHRGAGEVIVLLTGAPDFIARPLAELVGAALWRATRCSRENGVYTAEPPAEHPFGATKLSYAQEICREVGAELSECAAYADSAYDLPLLERVGRPVAAHPDRALKRAARRAGWEVLDALAKTKGAARTRTADQAQNT